jgi:hypothetical protein
MRSDKVYIAGKITGQPREITIRNFKRGETLCINNGFNFINPTDFVREGSTHLEAMKILIPKLFECKAILLLNDYQYSEGAMIEKALAAYTEILIYFEDDLN